MRVSALQFDIRWEDKVASQARMTALLAQSPPTPGSLVILPELGDVGFSRNLEAIVDDRSERWACGTAIRWNCWVQHGWAEPSTTAGRAWNVLATISPSGEVVDRYRKIFTFTPGGEQTAFDSGDRLHLVDIDSVKVCPLLCYDLRFPELFRLATQAGAEVFTVAASWPAVRSSHWRSLLIARAIENQAWLVGVNRTGNDPHLSYDGQSCVISPMGEAIARMGDAEGILDATLDLTALREWRRQLPALADIRSSLLGSIPVVRT